MDFYRDYQNVYNRLKQEYIKYGRLIILVDFDDTLYNTYAQPNRSYEEVAQLVRRWKPYAQIIIWTVSQPERYLFIESYLKEINVPFDGINIDGCVNGQYILPGVRKVYANATLDDRCGLATVYQALYELVLEIEEGI